MPGCGPFAFRGCRVPDENVIVPLPKLIVRVVNVPPRVGDPVFAPSNPEIVLAKLLET